MFAWKFWKIGLANVELQAANSKLWRGQDPGNGTASIRRELKGGSAEDFEVHSLLLGRTDAGQMPNRYQTDARHLPRSFVCKAEERRAQGRVEERLRTCAAAHPVPWSGKRGIHAWVDSHTYSGAWEAHIAEQHCMGDTRPL